MATGTNAIATRLEAFDRLKISPGTGTTNPDKCCTREEAIGFGAHSYGLPTNNKQLVKYSSLCRSYTPNFSNPGIIVGFNYWDYGGLYIMITITLYCLGLYYTKETRIDVTSLYKLNGMPNGYICITSIPSCFYTMGTNGTDLNIFPDLDVELPEGKELEVTNVTIDVSLYLEEATDSTLIDVNSGSGGGVLVRSIDASVGGDYWHRSNSSSCFYKQGSPFYNTNGMPLYGLWLPVSYGHGTDIITCYESVTTKNNIEPYIDNFC